MTIVHSYGRRILAVIIVAVLPMGRGAAQEPTRWSVAAITGTTSSGPAQDIEAAMRTAGYDDPSACWLFCSGFIHHPFSRTGLGQIGFPWLLELRYAWARPFGLELVTGVANIGTTLGYKSDSLWTYLGQHLFVDYAVNTWALASDVELGPLRVQAGPAYFRAESWRDHGGSAADKRKQAKLGWLAGAGWSVRVTGAVRLEVRGQYRAVGQAVVGPYFGESTPTAGSGSSGFPEIKASFSHWFWGVGVGLGF